MWFNFFVFSSFDNLLYSCGSSPYHGLNIVRNIYTPTNIEFFNNKDVLDFSINTSGYHTLVLTKNNEVYSFGHNRCYQLGYDIIDEDIDIDFHYQIEIV